MTKIDALYNLHATLGHMPYSRIERMILKGLWNGYSFDLKLLKQLANIKCDICMRAKLADGSHTGNLHTATIPWRMFSMDITGPFMQAILMSDLREAHSKKVISLCNKYGIVKQATAGYTPQYNAMVKDGLELMVRCHDVN